MKKHGLNILTALISKQGLLRYLTANTSLSFGAQVFESNHDATPPSCSFLRSSIYSDTRGGIHITPLTATIRCARLYNFLCIYIPTSLRILFAYDRVARQDIGWRSLPEYYIHHTATPWVSLAPPKSPRGQRPLRNPPWLHSLPRCIMARQLSSRQATCQHLRDGTRGQHRNRSDSIRLSL